MTGVGYKAAKEKKKNKPTAKQNHKTNKYITWNKISRAENTPVKGTSNWVKASTESYTYNKVRIQMAVTSVA